MYWIYRIFLLSLRVGFRVTLTANGKRQTSDSSWEFLKFENKQIQTSQNDSWGGGGGGGVKEQFALDVTVDLSGGKLKIPPKKSLKRELLWQKDDNTLQTGPATGVWERGGLGRHAITRKKHKT